MHLRIIEYIGSFPKGKCFATPNFINSEAVAASSPKTIRMHLAYLIAIGALKASQNGRKRILELALPEGPIMSQRDYRVYMGMAEYKYANGELTEEINTIETIPDELPLVSQTQLLTIPEQPQPLINEAVKKPFKWVTAIDRMEYYVSREWGLKREAVKIRCSNTCERCHYGKMDVCHHSTYIRFKNENLEDLLGLCDPCHAFIHGRSNVDPLNRSN